MKTLPLVTLRKIDTNTTTSAQLDPKPLNQRGNSTATKNPKGKLYILCVGVNTYKDFGYLNFAESDATVFASKFTNQNNQIFKQTFSYLFLGSSATYESIKKQLLITVSQQVTEDDMIIVLLSGKGVVRGENYRFHCSDFDDSRGTGNLDSDEVSQILNKSKSKAIVIFDACGMIDKKIYYTSK